MYSSRILVRSSRSVRRLWIQCPNLAHSHDVVRAFSTNTPRLGQVLAQPRFESSPSTPDQNLPIQSDEEVLCSTQSRSSALDQTSTLLRQLGIRPPSTLHDSLPGFLHYAARTGLSPTSTIYLGTLYEYVVAQVLRKHGIDVVRVGGRNDAGVDLIGIWHVPVPSISSSLSGRDKFGDTKGDAKQLTKVVKVFVQCKRFSTPSLATSPASSSLSANQEKAAKPARGKGRTARLTPALVRELQGAFHTLPSAWRNDPDTIGLLVGTRSCTKGMREAMGACTERGLGFALIDEVLPDGLGLDVMRKMAEDAVVTGGGESAEDMDLNADADANMPCAQNPTDKSEKAMLGANHSEIKPEASLMTTDKDTPLSSVDQNSSQNSLEDPLQDSKSPLPTSLPSVIEVKALTRQFLWNARATRIALEGVNVVPHFSTAHPSMNTKTVGVDDGLSRKRGRPRDASRRVEMPEIRLSRDGVLFPSLR